MTLNMCVTALASIRTSGTFFCVTATTQSFPLTAMELMPADLIALNAYSVTCDDGTFSSEEPFSTPI